MILLENNWGKVRCPHCDSVMKPEKEDIIHDYDEGDGEYRICPVCGRRIWFGHNDITMSEDYAENPVIYRILKGIKVHK